MEPITVSRMTDLAIRLSGTYINVDGAHGNQCWDSVARVAQLLGLPTVSTWGEGRWPGWAGNMWDAFPQSPAIAAAYERVGPDQPGQPGDTAIWGAVPGIYPSTHVANVVRDFGGLLLTLSQNSSAPRPDLPGYSKESTGPTIMQYLTKKGLLGYLRPRVTGTINPSSSIPEALGDRMATLDKDDLAAIGAIAVAERKTTVLEVRANAVATVNAVADLLEDAVYKLSVFTQKTDNQNTDRSIDDFRANLKAGLAEITAQHAIVDTEEGK